MSKPPKIDEKSLKGPDSFQKTGTELLSKLPLDKIPAVPTILVIVGLLLGYLGYHWWSSNEEEKSWKAYHRASKEPEDKRWDALSKFYQDHKGRRSAYFAALTLGDHYFDSAKKASLGNKADEAKADAEKALTWYDNAIKLGGLSESETQLLRVQKGGALELLGKIDEAQAEYLAASNLSSSIGKAYALLCLGRTWEMKKDLNKATEFYGRVATEFDNSQYAIMAKSHLRRLKSPIFSEGTKS